MAEWVKLEDYEAYLSKKRNADVRILSPKNKDFCSNCWDDFNWITKPNYCPHCGAKMSNTEEVIPYHRNDTIEELEGIKSEIKENSLTEYIECGEYIGEDTQEWDIVKTDKAFEIINNHISKLKGDNNE